MRKMENDSVGALYEALNREGFSDLGDEQVFRDKLGDERNRRQLYWALDAAGYEGLGDYGTFDDRLSACYADKRDSAGKSVADRAMDRWANSSTKWAAVAGEAAALTEAERQRKAAERNRYEAIVDLGIDEAKKRIPKKQPKLYPTGMGLYLPVPEPKGEGPTPEEERDGRLYKRVIRQLERAKRDRQIAEYADLHPADFTDATNWNGLKQFIHAAWKGIQSPSVYSFGTTDIADDLAAIRILKKAEKEGTSSLSQAEEDYITAMALANTASGLYDKTIYQQAGESTAVSAPYMVQFAATSGLGNALTAGARGALKRILTRNLTNRAGRKLADAAVQVAGVTARSAAMSLVQPTMVANVTDRLTDRLELNDRDEVTVARKGDNLASAIGKGFLANTIDNVSEMSGPMLKSLVGALPKGLKRLSPKTVEFVAQTGGAKAVGRFDALLKKAGWHGTLEEWGEEQVGTALNALLVGDSEWTDLVDLEQQLTTGLSVAAMGGTFAAIGAPGALARKRAIRKRIGESRRQLSAVGLSESEIAELDDLLVSGVPEQTGRFLVDEAVSLRQKGMSLAERERLERQLSAKMEYAAARSVYDGMIGALKEQIGSAVERQRAEIEASAHRDRGLLIESRTKSGGLVNVVGGHLVFSPDGTIDAEHSDETIYVRREGRNGVANVRELDRVMAVTPLQTELDRVLPSLKEQLARAEADEIESDDKPVESDRSVVEPGVETGEATVVRPTESDQVPAGDTGVSEREHERDADGPVVEEQAGREEPIDTKDVPVSETETDPFGKPLVKATDGTTVFGHISVESGLTEAPIRLSLGEDRLDEEGRHRGYGLLHIEAGHGKQIRDAGYGSVATFVETVAKNYTDILEGRTVMNRPTYLLQVSDEHDNTLFVQLSRDGNFWNVNSAGIFRKKYSRHKTKVFTVPAFRFGTDTDADRVNHDQTEDAVVTSGNSPQTFKNEDRQFSEEKQESIEKNRGENDVDGVAVPLLEDENGAGVSQSGYSRHEPKVFTVPAFRFVTDTDADGVEHDQTKGAVVTCGDSPQTFENEDRQFSEEKQESIEKNRGENDVDGVAAPLFENGAGTVENDRAESRNEREDGRDAPTGERRVNATGTTDNGTVSDEEQGGQKYSEQSSKRQSDLAKKREEDNGVSEWYGNLHLSGELDQNNRPFILSPDDDINFGYITSTYHLPAAPIRLSIGDINNGYIHINRRHGKQIQKAGFNSIESFVKFVVDNFTRIQEGAVYKNEKNGEIRTYLIQLEDGHSNTLFVQLSRDEKFWNVNSAGVFGRNYGNKKKNIWSASEVQHDNSAVASDGLQSEPIAENGSTSNGTPSNISIDKNREKSRKTNDLGEKITSAETEYGLERLRRDAPTGERMANGKGIADGVGDVENGGGQNKAGANRFQYFAGTLSELISQAKRSARGVFKKVISPVSSRLKYDLSTKGIVIDDGYMHVIDNIAIRHTLKKQGSEKGKNRGQVPITDTDFDKIADVVEHYDTIEVESGKRDNIPIRYSKTYADGTTIYVEEKRNNRKELAAVTMWKMRNPTLTDANRTETTPISDFNEELLQQPIDGTLPNGHMAEIFRQGEGTGKNTVGRADSDERALESEIWALSSRLHTPVRVVRRLEDITDGDPEVIRRKRGAKGWFDVRTGEVTLVLPNADGLSDVRSTLLHEIVGHKGLRGLLGDGTSAFYEQVYADMPAAVRERYTSRYGRTSAAEEYVADLAEHPERFPGIWSRIVGWFREQLRRAGLPVSLGETDIRYLLWKSGRRLTGSEDLLDMARHSVRDAAFRRELSSENDSTDYDTRYLYREIEIKTGVKIDRRRTNVKQLSRGIENRLQSENISWDLTEADTGSRYYRFPYKGISVTIRIADHTKPYEEEAPHRLSDCLKLGVRGLGDNRLDRVDIDTVVMGFRTEDVFRLLTQLSGLSAQCYAHAPELRTLLQDYAYLSRTPRKDVLTRMIETVKLKDDELVVLYLNRMLSKVEESESYRRYVDRMQTDSYRISEHRYLASNGIEIDLRGDRREIVWITDTSGFLGRPGSKSHRAKISDRRAAIEEVKAYLRAKGIEPIDASMKGDRRDTDDEKILYRRDEVKDRIADLFRRALSGEFKGKSISIGTLTGEGKTYLEQISGVTFKEHVDFVLNPSDLVHIYKDHFGKNEKDKGQNIPLDIEDIHNLADVISNPDKVIFFKEGEGSNRNMFYFFKEAEDGTYNLMEIYSDRKGNLTVKTFYKTRKDATQRVMDIEKSLLLTSETYSDAVLSDAKIPQMFENTNVEEKNLLDGDGAETYTVGRADSDERALESEIWALSSRLHTPVRVVRRLEDITDGDPEVIRRKRGAKGWFDVRTGEVTLVLPNADGLSDVRSTLLHEIVGHKGLRGLLGDGTSAFYEQVYADMPAAVRERYTSRYGRTSAAEEYVADLAEHPERFPGIWSRIVGWFREQLRRAGLPVSLGETDIRYLLWKSGRRLTGSEDLLDMARHSVRDAAFRRELSSENDYKVVMCSR